MKYEVELVAAVVGVFGALQLGVDLESFDRVVRLLRFAPQLFDELMIDELPRIVEEQQVVTDGRFSSVIEHVGRHSNKNISSGCNTSTNPDSGQHLIDGGSQPVLGSADAGARRLSVSGCFDRSSTYMTVIPRRARYQTDQALYFADFVREHQPALSRHVARVYGDQDIASVVAAVFAIAWQRYDDIPQHRAEPWLKSVARHVVSNTRRGDARWASLQRAARVTTEVEAASVDDDWRLQAKIVAEALAMLSHDDQYILRLQGADEPSSDELATILGVSVRAARTRLSRARQRLHDACEQLYASGEESP